MSADLADFGHDYRPVNLQLDLYASVIRYMNVYGSGELRLVMMQI